MCRFWALSTGGVWRPWTDQVSPTWCLESSALDPTRLDRLKVKTKQRQINRFKKFCQEVNDLAHEFQTVASLKITNLVSLPVIYCAKHVDLCKTIKTEQHRAPLGQNNNEMNDFTIMAPIELQIWQKINCKKFDGDVWMGIGRPDPPRQPSKSLPIS